MSQPPYEPACGPPAMQPGEKLGYLEVIELIATTGQSVIYKAHDRLLGRDVVIKQLGGSQAQQIEPGERSRLASMVDRLRDLSQSDPHLVQIHQLVDDPRGLFLVTEFVEGLTLDQTLVTLKGPAKPRRALSVISHAAMGLRTLHAAEIIHRDLKPSNILLPRGGTVKITDFGLCTVLSEQDAMTIGTARYMAPELFSEAAVDRRADLYALGMISYELLAGRPAFEQAFRAVLRDQRNQALRWMKWHTNQRLTPPPLRQFNEQVPEALEELVQRMMAKDPAQRIESAEQVLEIITQRLTGEGQAVTAAPAPSAGEEAPIPDPSDEPTAPLPRRSSSLRWVVAAIAGLLLIVGGFIGTRLIVGDSSDAARYKAAINRFDTARELLDQRAYSEAQPIFAELAENWPDDPLGRVSHGAAMMCLGFEQLQDAQQHVVDGEYSKAAELYEAAQAALDEADQIEQIDHGQIDAWRKETIAGAAFADEAARIDQYLEAGQFDDGRRRIRSVREGADLTDIERAELDELSNRLEGLAVQAEIDRIIAQVDALIDQGQYDRAIAMLDEAEQRFSNPQLRQRMGLANRKLRFEKARLLARRAEASGDLDTAIEQYVIAQELEPRDELAATIADLRSRAALQRGYEQLEAGQREAAARSFADSLAYRENKAAQTALAQIELANKRDLFINAAEAAFSAGEYEKAIRQFEQAQQMAVQPETQERINEANLRRHIALAHRFMQRNEMTAAEQELKQAEQINSAHPLFALAIEAYNIRKTYLQHLNKGDELRTEGKFSRAIVEYRAALETIADVEIDPEPVLQRLDDAQFDNLIAHSRSAMQAGEWRKARGLLTAARQMHPNDQTVTQLLEEVEAEIDD